VTIAIAEDHPVYASGLTAILQKHLKCTITHVNNGAELIDLLGIMPVDLALVDLQMPVMHGLAAARIMSKHYPGVPIIMLSTYYEPKLAEEALKAGVNAYMTKNAPIEVMLEQIHLVMAGGGFPVFPGANPIPPPPGIFSSVKEPKAYNLSKREVQIVQYIRKGFTSKQIANDLYLSFNTVRQHRKHILHKLGLKNAQELVEFAISQSL
jgi:DNA-binding NarL/FixJ family response regulator